MKTTDLFNNRSSKKINEAIETVFGQKLNLDAFTIEQLEDSRNRLRTQIYAVRSSSGFNETVENESFTKAQWMLDSINSEIVDREQHVDEAGGYSANEHPQSRDYGTGDQDDDLPFDSDDEQMSDKDKFGNIIKNKAQYLAKRGMRRAMGQSEGSHSQYYYEKLADEVFALDPDLDTGGRAEDVLDAAYPLMIKDLGEKDARYKLNYDEDFPSDFVSAYSELQRGKSKQGVDAIHKMFGGNAKDLTKGLSIRSKKDNESNEQHINGEGMDQVQESATDKASAVVTAKTMVDRVGRWIEELAGMENDTLLSLGDTIRDEMGQEEAKNFLSNVAPAIQQALQNLKATRETLATGVRGLTGEEQSAEIIGTQTAPADTDDMAPTDPDAMNSDEFAASEPATGGMETAGRAQRESIDRSGQLLRVLAG